MKLDTFTRAYIEAALWSSMDDEGEPLDRNYDVDDISPATLDQMIDDADAFQAAMWEDISGNLTGAGIDFWLTREGHGSGFWNGRWGEAGDRLTERAHAFGEFDLYVGDDGMIHHPMPPGWISRRKRWRPGRSM